MKWLFFGVAGYYGLLMLRDKQANDAIAACGGIGSPGMLNCAGYVAVQQKWDWLPRVHL